MQRKLRITAIVLLIFTVLAVVLVGCHKKSEGMDMDVYYAMLKEKEDAYDVLNLDSAQGQFVMIGDSIVELYLTEYIQPYVDITVYNRGIGGDNSLNVYNRLDNNVLSINPSKVFILVGTNDLDLNQTVDIIVENIIKSADKCLESGVEKVLVCSLLPVNQSMHENISDKRNNVSLCKINEKLKAYCDQREGAVYVDVHSELVDENGNFDENYALDGLHPNPKGYEEITKVLVQYI